MNTDSVLVIIPGTEQLYLLLLTLIDTLFCEKKNIYSILKQNLYFEDINFEHIARGVYFIKKYICRQNTRIKSINYLTYRLRTDNNLVTTMFVCMYVHCH